MGSVFHKGKWVERYGLTCGYWSNRASKVDAHVMAEHRNDAVYDLCTCHSPGYEGQPLHKCTYKKENTA